MTQFGEGILLKALEQQSRHCFHLIHVKLAPELFYWDTYYPPCLSTMTSTYSRSFFRAFAPALRAQRVPVTRPRCSPFATSFRGYAAAAGEQPRLRLGVTAPNFQAKTTQGDIDFHKYIDGSWAILFSHPADFTPVCTTELGAFAKMRNEFEKRGVKMIGLSANDLNSHDAWIKDINDISNTNLQFPIIADADRKVAFLYDMVDQQDLTNIDEKGIAFTIRSVFIIDPQKKIRLVMLYPASVGRNSAEVLRVIDSLQTGDKKGVTTPIDWQVGQDVIVPPTVSTEDAKKKFADVREVRPYLRFTSGQTK